MTQKNNLSMMDVWNQQEIPPGPQHIQRRRIGAAMNSIMDKLIRLDADLDQITELADQFEGLEKQISEYGRMDQMEIFKRFLNKEGSEEDALNITDYDILTGLSSPLNLPMKTWIDGDKVRGEVRAGLQYQGPPGRIHGGMVAAIFDVLLAQTQAIAKVMGFTGTLKIKYLKATPLNTDLTLEAEVIRLEGRKLFNRGIIMANGEVTAEAEGIWIQADMGKPS